MERREQLVRAAIPKAAATRLTDEFEIHLAAKGLKARNLPPRELLSHLNSWLRNQGTEQSKILYSHFIAQGKQKGLWKQDPFELPPEKRQQALAEWQPEAARLANELRKLPPRQTLGPYVFYRVGTCVAKTTAFAEIASALGIKVKYRIAAHHELDMSKIGRVHRVLSHLDEASHVYPAALVDGKWENYDPTLGLTNPDHGGRDISRETHASNMLTMLGKAQLDKGDKLRALKTFDLAIELDPENDYPRLAKSVTLTSLKRLDEAMRELDKATTLAHGPEPFFAKAIFSYHLGRKAEALEAAKKAKSLANRKTRTYRIAGNIERVILKELKPGPFRRFLARLRKTTRRP
jgi:tetratricopeptide (TPR) repeat protein